jgi:hypothetical protein
MRANGSLAGYVNYIEEIAREDKNFHVLAMNSIYPLEFFGDSSHLTITGCEQYTKDLIRLLNRYRVPGGPFGVAKQKAAHTSFRFAGAPTFSDSMICRR